LRGVLHLHFAQANNEVIQIRNVVQARSADVQTIAQQGLKTLDSSELSVSNVLRILKAGVDIQRLAMGASNDRHDILTSIVLPWVYDLVQMFSAVNVLEEPQERINE
jgi:hypothetical protein